MISNFKIKSSIDYQIDPIKIYRIDKSLIYLYHRDGI
jgi:hypothetical protein